MIGYITKQQRENIYSPQKVLSRIESLLDYKEGVLTSDMLSNKMTSPPLSCFITPLPGYSFVNMTKTDLGHISVGVSVVTYG